MGVFECLELMGWHAYSLGRCGACLTWGCHDCDFDDVNATWFQGMQPYVGCDEQVDTPYASHAGIGWHSTSLGVDCEFSKQFASTSGALSESVGVDVDGQSRAPGSAIMDEAEEDRGGRARAPGSTMTEQLCETADTRTCALATLGWATTRFGTLFGGLPR